MEIPHRPILYVWHGSLHCPGSWLAHILRTLEDGQGDMIDLGSCKIGSMFCRYGDNNDSTGKACPYPRALPVSPNSSIASIQPKPVSCLLQPDRVRCSNTQGKLIYNVLCTFPPIMQSCLKLRHRCGNHSFLVFCV